MENTNATTWITLRVTLAEKARLLNMSRKAGDRNPSVTIVRKLFGREAAIRRTRAQARAGDTRRQRNLFPKGRSLARAK